FGPMRLAARRLRTYSCRLTPISSERVRKASSSHVGSRRNTAGYVIYLLRNGTKASGLRNREYDDDCGISASTLILAWDLKSGSPKPSAARLLNRPGFPGGSGYWISTRGWSLRWAS